jgi:hypothetical protein
VIQPPLIAVLLLAQVLAQPPCTVPAGPPCLPYSDPRLAVCDLSVGACFYVEWDEYTDVAITRVSMVIYPMCGDDTSAARLEQAGRAHLESLQSVSLEIAVAVEECVSDGYMDLTVEEVLEGP